MTYSETVDCTYLTWSRYNTNLEVISILKDEDEDATNSGAYIYKAAC